MESMFDKYHQSIGAEILFDKERNTSMTIASEADVLNYLKVIMGINAAIFGTVTLMTMIVPKINVYFTVIKKIDTVIIESNTDILGK